MPAMLPEPTRRMRGYRRRGRATSSPPQFGHVCCICAAQSGQNVHSKLQIRASSP
jgi:hypothetical protein